jgi:hypothetical protein
MKKQVVLFGSLFIAIALLMGVISCKKKSDSTTFTLSTLVAEMLGGNIDLNGATSPNNVPANPTIVATFSVAVNPASVNRIGKYNYHRSHHWPWQWNIVLT